MAKLDYFVPIEDRFGPPHGLTRFGSVSAGVFHPSENPLPDDIAFEFRHRTDDREHGFAQGSAAVQRLLVRHELDAKGAELFQC